MLPQANECWVNASFSPSESFKSTLSGDGRRKLNCSPQQPTVSALDVHHLESSSGIDRGDGAVEAVMRGEQPPAKPAANRETEAGVLCFPLPLDSDVNPLILEQTNCGSHYLTIADFLARPASKAKPRTRFVVTTSKAESPLVEPVIWAPATR